MDARELLHKVRSRLGREAGVGIATTYLYSATSQPPQNTEIRIAPMTRAIVECVALLGPCDPGECIARLDRGDLCYGTWLDGELAHYAWVQRSGTHAIDSAGITVGVRPREFWIYNCRTADAFRGRGIYPATLAQIISDQLRTGAVRGWIYAADDNVPSQRAIVKAGFERCGVLRAVRIGRRFHPFGPVIPYS